jgi:hypothetical protein
MKTIILLMLVVIQFGCSVHLNEEVYPTNMNDCEPITNNEDYINIDCKIRSVNRLQDDVKYMDEPALVTLQGYSLMTSGIKVCSNLTSANKRTIQVQLDDIYKMVAGLYDFENHPEFKKEIDLINEKLKGKFESKIKEQDCKDLKELADDLEKSESKEDSELKVDSEYTVA